MSQQPEPALSPKASLVRELLERHATNSNSFLTLYAGYRYFHSARTREAGCVPYHDARHAWMGAAEPLAAPDDAVVLLHEFATAARAAGKRAMFLPVGRPFMELAIANGYGAAKIGSEPLFSLTSYDPSLGRVSTAKRLHARGARVSEFTLCSMTHERRAELDRMVSEWIASRKMEELGFLNQVHPWELSDEKRYFWAMFEGKPVAFLAAVPTPREKSWYLVDVFRFADSPPGATELLILESMRLLKESGALRVSLGVAPLSDLESETSPSHPTLHRLMRLAYEKGGLLYNFRSLHQFKLKFHPTSVEPAYLLFSPPVLGPVNALGVLETFTGGPLRALGSGLLHQLTRYRATRRRRVTHALVPRSPVRDSRHWLGRAPVTLALIAASVVSFALIGRHGPAASGKLAATWADLAAGNLAPFARAPFFHRGPFHFLMSSTAFVLFAGRLETVAGSSFTTLSFLLTATLALPITGVLVFLSATALRLPGAWERFTTLAYLGPSVGLFGCLGALTTFFEHGHWFLGTLLAVTTLYAAIGGTPMPLVHVTAALLGVGVAKWLTSRPRGMQ